MKPRLSAFAIEDGVIYHAYSTYARGLHGVWGIYQWLDRTPKGRNESDVWYWTITHPVHNLNRVSPRRSHRHQSELRIGHRVLT